jgi:hypothetical protein
MRKMATRSHHDDTGTHARMRYAQSMGRAGEQEHHVLSAGDTSDEEPLALPALDGGDDGEGAEDPGNVELGLPMLADEAHDDGEPADVLLELPGTGTPSASSSALGDDASGLADSPDAALDSGAELGAGSLLDSDASPLGTSDDDALGLEPLREATDRSDTDGLDDPAAEQLDAGELPTMDEGDDGEVDVGLGLDALPEPPDDDDAVPS